MQRKKQPRNHSDLVITVNLLETTKEVSMTKAKVVKKAEEKAQKNYATLEAEHAALKEEVAELRRIVEDHLSKGADFGHGGL